MLVAGESEQQYVEPLVSRRKFDREIAEYRTMEREYQRRGWFLAEVSYPIVVVLLTAPHVSPPAVVTGVHFDYTNYDARPPSVRLINPFTREPYVTRELPTRLNQQQVVDQPLAGVPAGFQFVGAQTLMQSYSEDDIPFLCLAGVREYHDHPGHSGDPWELQRSDGAGRLVRLLDVIHTYGVAPLAGWSVNFNPKVAFGWGEAPR